mmetsp:Transcript_28679/g.34930  ORF Transcript_28679/g.34930 Transcript_28679/m.34930 type:complete len:101 (+) Transcript_28679:133-435(+)
MHHTISQEQQDYALAVSLQRRENELAIADIRNEEASNNLRTGWSGHAALTSSKTHPQSPSCSDVYYRVNAGLAYKKLSEEEKYLDQARFRRETRGVKRHI